MPIFLFLENSPVVAADVVPQLDRVLGGNTRAEPAAVGPCAQTVNTHLLVHIDNAVYLAEVVGPLAVAHEPALGFLAVLLRNADGALGDLPEEALGQAPLDDGGGEHIEVRAGGDHFPVVIAAQLGNIVALERRMDAAGYLQLGVILLERLGAVGKRLERLSPAELLDIVVHELGHFIAVVVLELLHALRAAAGPVVPRAAGDGSIGLGVCIVRLIPEEAVDLGLAGKLEAAGGEIVAEGIGVEAGEGQHLSGVRGDLTVVNIVLQEQRDLLTAEIFADAPCVREHAQTHFMRFLDYLVDIWEPEVNVELGDGENDGVAAVLDHLLKILLCMLDIVEAVVAYGCMLDGHDTLLIYSDIRACRCKWIRST